MERESRWRRLPQPTIGVEGVGVWDVAVAAILFAIMVIPLATREPVDGQRTSDAWSYLLAALMSLPFAGHRRWPLQTLGIVITSSLLYAVGHYSAYPGANVFVLVYALAAHTNRRISVIALVSSTAALVAELATQPDAVVTAGTWTSSILAMAVSFFAGENARYRKARWDAVVERAERAEREREEYERRAVMDERLRIARELHDVVAHSMSVIAVQAGTGHHLLKSDPAQAERALAVVEETSRTALVEMRRMLGVLRDADDAPGDDATGPRTPAVGLGALSDLVARVRNAGLAVELTTTGSFDDLSPGVDLSAYRIVQEALTNVIKHGGEMALVSVCRDDSGLVLDISDQGDRAGVKVASSGTHVGQGLIGMRERVVVLGGTFSAGPSAVGGYRVHAVLPMSPA